MRNRFLLGAAIVGMMLSGCIVYSRGAELPDEAPYLALGLGMTREEVVKRVGPPDPTTQDPLGAWWYYLGDDHGPCYRIRFAENRVARIERFDSRRGIDELSSEELRRIKPVESP